MQQYHPLFDDMFDHSDGGMGTFVLGSPTHDGIHQQHTPIGDELPEFEQLFTSASSGDSIGGFPRLDGLDGGGDDAGTPGAASPFLYNTDHQQPARDMFDDRFPTMADPCDAADQQPYGQYGSMRPTDAPTTTMPLAAGHGSTEEERRQFMTKLTQHFHGV